MRWLRSRWTVVALVPAFFLVGFGIVSSFAGSDEPESSAQQPKGDSGSVPDATTTPTTVRPLPACAWLPSALGIRPSSLPTIKRKAHHPAQCSSWQSVLSRRQRGPQRCDSWALWATIMPSPDHFERLCRRIDYATTISKPVSIDP